MELGILIRIGYHHYHGKIGYYLGFIAGSIAKFFVVTVPEKWNDFVNWCKTIPETLKTFFTVTIPKKWNDLVNWMSNLPENLKEIGKNIVDGLINGFSEKWTEFKKGVEDFFGGFVDGIKDSLGIHSPSTVFKDIGINIVEGLINGIGEMISKVGSKIEEIKNTLIDKFWRIKDKIVEIFSDIGIKIGDFISNTIKTAVNGVLGKMESTINGFIGTLNKTIDVMNNIPGMGLGKINTISVPRLYADGGMPEKGEMFVANEAGPELVGKIGNRSAVANSNQIISGIAQGVYSAVVDANSVSSNSGSVQLSGKINGKELLQIMIDGINGIKKQTGECPIEVY